MARAKTFMKAFLFRLPPALIKEFEETAKATGRTRQEAMIEAINQWLNNQ